MRLSRDSTNLQRRSAEEIKGDFDVVTCMEMLEHVPDPARMTGRGDASKAGWRPICVHNQPESQILLLAIVAAEYLLNLIPRGTHDTTASYGPHSWSAGPAQRDYPCVRLRAWNSIPDFDVRSARTRRSITWAP